MSLDGAAPEVSSEFAVRNLGDKIEEGAPKTSSEFCVTKKEHRKRVQSSALRDLGNEIEVRSRYGVRSGNEIGVR